MGGGGDLARTGSRRVRRVSWHIHEPGPRQDLWKAITEGNNRFDGLP